MLTLLREFVASIVRLLTQLKAFIALFITKGPRPYIYPKPQTLNPKPEARGPNQYQKHPLDALIQKRL